MAEGKEGGIVEENASPGGVGIHVVIGLALGEEGLLAFRRVSAGNDMP